MSTNSTNSRPHGKTSQNSLPTPYLSIILPAYNDSDALAVFLPQVLDFCESLNRFCEVIVVDDGSQDASKDVVMQNITDLTVKAGLVALQLISLSRNFGKEPALSAGLAHAKGDWVAMMDADGQHPLSVLQKMLQIVTQQSDIDMVAAIQSNRPNESRLAKTLKSGFYHFIQDTRRYEIKPNAGDFRLMQRKVVDALLSLPERQRFMKGLYAWVGFNTLYLPFVADARHAGDSKFNYASLFELAMIGITSFSQKPLRLISRMGMLISILAICYGLFIVLEKLMFDNNVDGWATVAAGIMFSAGLQLICLGVIGEYIGRLFEEVKQRPLYVVDKHIQSHNIDATWQTHKDNNSHSDTHIKQPTTKQPTTNQPTNQHTNQKANSDQKTDSDSNNRAQPLDNKQ